MGEAIRQCLLETPESSGNALVIGLGKSGLACANYLFEEGWDVEVADTRNNPPLEKDLERDLPGTPLHKGPISPQLFMNFDLVVVGPLTEKNSKVAQLAKQYGARVVSYLDLFMEDRSESVIAISGTNGKSTVASLVAEIIEACGKTVRTGGTSALELLNGARPDAYVLELTPMHLEQTVPLKANVATALNVTPDRQDYTTIRDYTESLLRVYRGARNCVLNREDPATENLRVSGNCISYGLDKPPTENDFGIIRDRGKDWYAHGSTKLVRVEACLLQGRHNQLNLLAAFALAQVAGYEVDRPVARKIAKFEGLPFCCSEVGEWKGISWINDSKSTNVNAAIAALLSADNPAVLIAGGINNGMDFSKLTQAVNGQLRGCVLFGRDQQEIGESLRTAVDTQYVDNIYEAVQAAAQMAENGDRVVFSPACISYDMFIDFRQRGEHFTQAVKEYYGVE